MIAKARFGNVKKIGEETVAYTSTSWSELSKTVEIAMYPTVPGTMESVEYSSTTLDVGGILNIEYVIVPENYDVYEPEIKEEFIEIVKKREKNTPIKIDDIDSLLINQ